MSAAHLPADRPDPQRCLIEAHDVCFSFGETPALRGASWQ